MIDYNSFSIINFYTPHMAQIRNKIWNDEIYEYKRLLFLQKSKRVRGPNRLLTSAPLQKCYPAYNHSKIETMKK